MNSLKILYLRGKFIRKKYFKPSCIRAISLKTSNLDKSMFPPEIIQTTFLPLIYSLFSSKAATPNAPDGSTIKPLSYRDKIEVATCPSLTVSIFVIF